MVKVLVGGTPATINNYVWRSKDVRLADMLNGRLPWYGVSPADPNPDLTAAQDAVKKFGGEVLSFTPVEYVKGRIY